MLRLLVIAFALSLAGCSDDSKPAPAGTTKAPANTPPAKGQKPAME